MKNRNFFKNLILTTLTMTALSNASFASSGDKQGNGGADIIYKGHHYLLDLYEAGIQNDVYFSGPLEVAINPEIDLLVKFKLGPLAERKQIKPETIALVSRKLSEIALQYPALGVIYRFMIQASQINSPDGVLAHPYVESSVLIYSPKEQLRRVAVRKDNIIYLNPVLLEKFDPANQAALFVHEWTSNFLGESGGSNDTRAMIGSFFNRNGSPQVVANILSDYGFSFALNSSPHQKVMIDGEHLNFIDNLWAYAVPYYETDTTSKKTSWSIGSDTRPFHIDLSRYEKINKAAQSACTEAVYRSVTPEDNETFAVQRIKIMIPTHIVSVRGGVNNHQPIVAAEAIVDHTNQTVYEKRWSFSNSRVESCSKDLATQLMIHRKDFKTY